MRRRSTYRADHIGRLRIAAAKILSEGFGFEVHPWDIKPAIGRPRSDWRQDIYRWELFANNGRLPVVCACWLTLTDFVKQAKRNGFHVNSDKEIYPNDNNEPQTL